MKTLHSGLIGTQTEIEAMTGAFEGMTAYATDTNLFGTFNGSSWDWWGSGSLFESAAFMQASDTKAQGTDGGTFTAGAWQTRDINTEDVDVGNNMSISSNQITLAAGTYRCLIFAPAQRVNDHRARLYNTTGAATVLDGSSTYSSTTGSFITNSIISGRFTIAASQALEIQHYCDVTKTTDGFGHAANYAGMSETYTIAMFWKESVYDIDEHSCEGRLTLTSGTPVTTSDVTAATNVYFTPYKGDRIALYNGSSWDAYNFTERTLSLSGNAADTNFDIFLYDDAGTLTLEAVAWTDATNRATALTTQNGVYVKSGDTTRRYLGTIRTTSTTGQCEDSEDRRFVWNYYNRVWRRMYIYENTAHTYASSTIRYWNNDNTLKMEYVIGVVEDQLDFSVNCRIYNGYPQVALGEDGTTPVETLTENITAGITQNQRRGASGFELPQLGYHFYAVVEANYSGTGDFFLVESVVRVLG